MLLFFFQRGITHHELSFLVSHNEKISNSWEDSLYSALNKMILYMYNANRQNLDCVLLACESLDQELDQNCRVSNRLGMHMILGVVLVKGNMRVQAPLDSQLPLTIPSLYNAIISARRRLYIKELLIDVLYDTSKAAARMLQRSFYFEEFFHDPVPANIIALTAHLGVDDISIFLQDTVIGADVKGLMLDACKAKVCLEGATNDAFLLHHEKCCRDKFLAVCMAGHSRLGTLSLLKDLDDGIIILICRMAQTREEPFATRVHSGL